MKINYANNSNQTNLRYIEDGGVFRPTNSREVYIKTDLNAMDDVFSDLELRLTNFYCALQDLPVDSCEELIACVNLTNGEFVFLHRDLEVEKLDCVLNIKGN